MESGRVRRIWQKKRRIFCNQDTAPDFISFKLLFTKFSSFGLFFYFQTWKKNSSYEIKSAGLFLKTQTKEDVNSFIHLSKQNILDCIHKTHSAFCKVWKSMLMQHTYIRSKTNSLTSNSSNRFKKLFILKSSEI